MQTIRQMAETIVAREGGYVNDPDDPGGATNFGVTIGTMRQLGLDLDGDGQVSSAQELSDLIEDSSFDKGRFELTQNKLWLAYQSGCRTCEQ